MEACRCFSLIQLALHFVLDKLRWRRGFEGLSCFRSGKPEDFAQGFQKCQGIGIPQLCGWGRLQLAVPSGWLVHLLSSCNGCHGVNISTPNWRANITHETYERLPMNLITCKMKYFTQNRVESLLNTLPDTDPCTHLYTHMHTHTHTRMAIVAIVANISRGC